MTQNRLSDVMSESNRAIEDAQEHLNHLIIQGINLHFDAGISTERERIIDLIKRQVCFDALADHDLMATFRMAHPEVVGRCAHHGGKCTDLLILIGNLENKKMKEVQNGNN